MTDRMTDEEFAEIEELDLATGTLEWGLRKAIRVEHAALKTRDKEVDAVNEWLIGITGTSGDAAFESITPDDLRGAIVELTTLRAKVAEDLEAACKAVMQAGIATGHADTILMMLTGEVLPYIEELRARVAELERELESHKKPGGYWHIVATQEAQRAKAAEVQLTALREGLEGLVAKWREGGDYFYCCLATELQSLITQSRPSVNSVDGINAGENSGGGV